ncbi:ISKra4 family transposase, partial [Rhabdochromatium marinum]|nr:ISKra4 family transposase [Rhabdochromatium marinum]MBK1650378.1 ISKra4 family transposase [Rhabdochromatium marinum]
MQKEGLAITAQLINIDGHQATLQVTIDLSGTMLEAEARIQAACNSIGRLASAETLKRFDTDGSPITMGAIKWTKRGVSPKTYQPPYGAIEVERNVYQTSQGGRIYCPLEASARLIRQATPLFA